MKRKKGLKSILALFLSLLVIMNSVLTPARIYAEEEETEATVATEETAEVVKEEAPAELKEELKFEAVAEKEMVLEEKAIQAEVKMEVLVEQPAVLEEKKELAAEKLELKEEIKEAVKEVEEIDKAVEEAEEAIDEGRVPDDQPIKLTIHYCGIIQTNGVEKEMQDSNTLSPGVGWNITLKKFMNKIPKEKFSNNGITYEFVNWIDANGNPVTGTLKFKREDFDRDTDLYFYAVYNITEPTILKFRYIDNVSTGSGSWSNSQGTFESYSHTFAQPEDQPHYQFLYWLDQDNVTYGAGDTKVIAKTDIESGKTTEMSVYAIWQPSVTVNYYDDEGKLINSVEKFSDYDVYSYSAENRDEETFLGWSETKGGTVAQALTYSAPAAGSSKTSPAVYSVYGVWTTDYRIEHYIEELDGSFSLKESETVSNAIVNTEAEAKNKEYTGFTYDATIEGSRSAGTVKGGLVLKFYYTRNSYTVTYAYENAPENASALPGEETYKYEADVKVADPATAEGYTFSGWDREDFQMPAENVTITGSWEVSRYTVTWVDEDGTVLEVDEEVEHGSMPSYDGETPSKKADGSYTYSFEGWTPEVSEVTGDITYQASYKKEKITVIPQTPEEPEPKTPSTVDPEPTVEETPIDETPIPLAEPEEIVEIEETEVPMAEAGSWALINLIATILSVLTALGMIITFFTGKEEEEDENEKDENEEESQNRKESKFLGLIPAILSVIVFIRTEDMRLPMVYIDRYTLLMVIILAVALLLAIVTRNRKKEREESYKQELATDQA
ncbi:MAG: hypothetical protein II004_00500 [Erysipelotrichaceae bacterium]|nr:hypothetical protein [Erysipelotrichaceae bacterium]